MKKIIKNFSNLKEKFLRLIIFFSKNYITKLRKDLLKIKAKNKKFKLEYSNSKKGKKLFCVLEQGSEKNNTLSEENRQIFTTEYSDFFRLNWKNDLRDKSANFFAKDICFSQGRSILYEKTKGKYDYYIFIDDDILIKSKNDEPVALTIKKQLLDNLPIHASVPNDCWPNYLGKYDKEIFPMKGGDVCVQIFRSDYAEIIFPVWFDGAHGSLWYSQFIAHILFPSRSIYLNKLEAYNTRHQDQFYLKGKINKRKKEVKRLFRKKLISIRLKILFSLWKEYSISNLFIDSQNKDNYVNYKVDFLTIKELIK